MAAFPAFNDSTLEALCAVLGDTTHGLSGREIGAVLRQCGVEDPLSSGAPNKRHRLFEALRQRQERDRTGNLVVAVIFAAMAPVRYVGKRAEFDDRRARMNTVLGFAGLSLGEDGKLRNVTTVSTVSEAEERAGRLRSELQRRRVHPDILRACRAELLQDNYFHAVLETTKSVAEKIRTRANLASDGARLVDDAFGLNNGHPRLAFNTLRTDTERSEHVGMMNLLKGMFSAFRNPTAHEPKTKWNVGEEDALDLLSLASLLHRRLDGAVRVPTP